MGQLISPPAAAGGGIPNGTLYWCTVGPVNPAPFLVRKGDGKITGSMFTFHGGGLYILDMTSLLTKGIYAIFPGGSYDAAAGIGTITLLQFFNSTFTGAFPDNGTALKFGIANNRWNGAAWVSVDDDFSIMILAQ